MTSFAVRATDPTSARVDALVVGVAATDDGPELVSAEVSEAWGRRLRPLLSSLGVTGKAGECVKVPGGEKVRAALVVFAGLGRAPDAVARQRAAGAAARAIGNSTSVALALGANDAADVRGVLLGFLLGGYRFETFRHDTATPPSTPSEVVVLHPGARRAEIKRALEEAEVLSAAVTSVRDWVNTPAGDLTPELFAASVKTRRAAVTKGRNAPKVELTTYDEEQLAELGCGGILGVGQGSANPPRLVELRYAPKGATTHLALVGKGITFDSGGLSIKPAQSMTTMKCDMAGAATVIAATLAIAELGLPVRVTTYAPMAENMVSGSSIRPGDILTAANGRTVEILNTDAEGRLVLMDGLSRAAAEQPDLIVDVATLTGAMVVALGDRMAGVMGTEDVVDQVLAAGVAAGEALWPMPLPEEVRERVNGSKIADLAQHDWIRWGSGLFAGAFLREFTADLPWAHVDVAGPAFNSGGAHGHVTSGGTGFGVTTLVELARSLG